MATVKPPETHSSGLGTLSNTLEIFDTFKNSNDEEKESDEESFHLPMLDCDEDLDNITKEVQNGETEDDILNKFNTDTPDLDSKIEESILNETEYSINNENSTSTEAENVEPEEDEEICNAKEAEQVSKHENVDIANSLRNGHVSPDSAETMKDLQKEELVFEGLAEVVNEELNNENALKETFEISSPLVISPHTTEVNEDADETNEISNTEILEEKPEDETDIENCTDSNPTVLNELVNLQPDNYISNIEDSKMDVNSKELDNIDNVEESPKILDHDGKFQNDIEQINLEQNETDILEDTPLDIDSEAIKVSATNDDTDNLLEKLTAEINDSGTNVGVESCSPNELKAVLNNSDKNITVNGNLVDEKSNINENNITEDSNKPNQSSNDLNKDENLPCDNLLNISIIRDIDEDNASALEDTTNYANSSEKSDNDEQDDDKIENDIEESEMEQEDTLLSMDKDENMEFEDDTTNFCDQDSSTNDMTVVNGKICDSDSKSNDVDLQDGQKVSSESENSVSDIYKTGPMENGLETISDIKIDDESIENPVADTVKERSVSQNKRPLPEEDESSEILNKRIKKDSPAKEVKDEKIDTLLTFRKFMQHKKIQGNLTRSDLEQFCLQKICEAILHRTDVGELHQTIKKQEQLIETLRKDQQQLAKQARDLDIVNKKLMTELKLQNGNKKPLVPLKITRSVGLQVKLNISTETVRRKQTQAPSSHTTASSPRTPNTTPTVNRVRNIAPANSSVVRQVAASPRKTQSQPSTPLLSQALQQANSRQATPSVTAAKRPIARAKSVSDSPKSSNPGVIDLTDEDDKALKNGSMKILNKTVPLVQQKTVSLVQNKQVIKTSNNPAKTVGLNQVKTAAKIGTPTRAVTALPQGVRLTQTQVKSGITIQTGVVTSTPSGTTTQLMYVVQPSSLVNSTAGSNQKALLLNFQPTSGVINSALNGSAVSVISSKTSNAIQLKPVTPPRKHPAPLPLPPVTPINQSLKPLLPKPHLSIRKTDTGIILQWRMPYNLDKFEGIASYQLFAYQETNSAPNTDMWRKVGDVKALALPMACTLTQFADKNKYYFAVRSVDVHKRIGAFSDPEEISL